uniref:NADH-ubiquinone oxidoreductase chain 4 n=1 Tax=Tremex columba TaxID=222809 RepID=A0A3G5BC64_TRECO|nr:NADH dehydrogenase subunit 4 [Tremex columba]AYV97238.1 NADH dehydrogenase subunit 4 [Tremex columba]
MMSILVFKIFFFFFLNKEKNNLKLCIESGLMIFFFIWIMKINKNDYFSNLMGGMGMDKISFYLLMLLIYVVIKMIMVSKDEFSKSSNSSKYGLLIISMFVILFFSLSVLSYLWFYFLFESSLFLLVYMIYGWGSYYERKEAGVYLLFFTLFCSLPFLYIMSKFMIEDSISLMSDLIKNSSYIDKMTFFLMMVIFLMKLPMIFFHVWLPKAHVEAPLSGSLILAGIMLKMGGYGMYRMFMLMKLSCSVNMMDYLYLSYMGGIFMSLVSLIQIDLKAMIAYSSVVHMASMIGGVSTMCVGGGKGGMMLMIGHGICSSFLFFMAMVIYWRVKSRNLYMNKGMMQMLLGMGSMWFMMNYSNMSGPFNLNFLGEIFLLVGMYWYDAKMIYLIILFMFVSVLFTLYMYSMVQGGKINHIFGGGSVKVNEVLLSYMFCLFMYLFVVEMASIMF